MPSEPRPSTEAEDAPLLVQNGVEESETNWLHSKRSLSTLGESELSTLCKVKPFLNHL